MSRMRTIALGLVFAITGGLLTAAFLTGKSSGTGDSAPVENPPAADATPIPAEASEHKAGADRGAASTSHTSAGISGQTIPFDPYASDFSERPGSVYKTSRLADEYSRLANLAAQGDLIAARTLFEQLQHCEKAPKNMQELEKYGKKLRDPEYPYASNPEQKGSVSKWTGQLAAAGDSKARLIFPFIAQPRDFERNDFAEQRAAFVETARNYLNEEISLGNGEALGAMASAYRRPIIEGHSTPFELDPAAAYRYYYAYALTPEGAPHSRIIMPSGEQINDIPGGILARMESQLTAEQIAIEREAAMRIVQQCCSATGPK
jgi:hypothetical protein